MIVSHSGVVAISSEVIPEGTYCSAHTTAPLPHTSSMAPSSAAEAHSRPAGARSPRQRLNRYSALPAIRKRMPAIQKGGMVSMAKRMAT